MVKGLTNEGHMIIEEKTYSKLHLLMFFLLLLCIMADTNDFQMYVEAEIRETSIQKSDYIIICLILILHVLVMFTPVPVYI